MAVPVGGKPILEMDVSTNGRFIGRTNECGSFMLMNASFMDGVLQDNGTFLAVEPQFGISQQRPAMEVILAEEKS